MANVVFGAAGLAIMVGACVLYSDYYHKWHDSGAEAAPSPWFIYAIGSSGGFVLLTAMAGIVGVWRHSKFLLNVHVVMLLLLLASEALLLIGSCQNDEWKQKLPHDETGAAAKVLSILQSKLRLAKLIGVAVLGAEILTLMFALALSALYQQIIEYTSDEDDELWMRHRLMDEETASHSRNVPQAAGTSPTGSSEVRTDPWSRRMREKYGLDTSHFSYDPERRRLQELTNEDTPTSVRSGQRCSIM